MSLASLARKYTEDAITTLATIMKDKGAPASARIRAATELLNRGYGRPPQSIEVLTPSSEIPEFPTPEETYAEVRRRGLLPVLELVAEEMEREDRGSHHRREAEDPASIRAAGKRGTAPLTKTPTIGALQDEPDIEKSKSRRPTRPRRYPTSRPRKKSTPS